MSNQVDSILYRKIQTGKDYDNLIPESSCEKTYLGTGDTFFSMDGIKSNIEKNYKQVKKLSSKLRRGSLRETCQAVYNFLYSHIQYRSDGSDQNLRSPACTWHDRKNGVDCKSFSIFAGSILVNLGHKFYIRKIKQPTLAPDQFTHVYIVVPNNQKSGSLADGYFVIDATKHQNVEPAYTEKNDVYMNLRHYGLQSPETGIDTEAEEVIHKFCKFTTILKQFGVKISIVDRMREHVISLAKSGRNPEVNISQKGLIVERTFYPFIAANNDPVELPPIFTNSHSKWGLNAEEGNWLNDIWSAVKNEYSGSSGGWINWIVDQFKCRGSSATMKDVKYWRQKKVDPYVLQNFNSISSIRPEDAASIAMEVNQFLHTLETAKHHQLFHKERSRSSCSKDGNQAMADFLQMIIDHVNTAVEKMKTHYKVQHFKNHFIASKIKSNPVTHWDINWKGETVPATSDSYMFHLKPGATGGGIELGTIPGSSGGGSSGGGSSSGGSSSGGSSSGGSSSGGGFNITEVAQGPRPTLPPSQRVNKAGFSNLLMIGLIGGGIYMYYNNKNKK